MWYGPSWNPNDLGKRAETDNAVMLSPLLSLVSVLPFFLSTTTLICFLVQFLSHQKREMIGEEFLLHLIDSLPSAPLCI